MERETSGAVRWGESQNTHGGIGLFYISGEEGGWETCG